jgi:exopolysaccharide biosynthesis polyprenyl glycosylphosphotransferase
VAVSDLGERRRTLSLHLRRGRWASLPIPSSAVTSIVDAAALLGAAALTRGGDLLGGAFVLATFVSLHADWTRPSRIAPRFSDDAGRLLARMSAPVLIALALAAADRWDPGALIPLSIGLVLAGRLISYRLNQVARSRGLVVERTILVGAGSIGSEIASILQRHPEYGLRPVGFVDSGEAPAIPLPLPVLGSVEELRELIRAYEIRRVIIAFGAARETQMVRALRACDDLNVFVHYVPRFFELGTDRATAADDLRCIPLVPLRRPGRRAGPLVKRTFDVVGALFGLALTGPILLAAALGVRLSSPGPVIFRQERVGRNGRPFFIYKFRTMRLNDDSETRWGVTTEYLTPIGRILRKTSIDELPQLVNVLRGQMSLVGPRPQRSYFAEQFQHSVPGWHDRHRMAGGMTGWAQIHGLRGGEQSSIPDRVRFDNFYIERWSLWRDLVVIARTFKSILSGDGGV